MDFIGEHLDIGRFGHFLVILAFVSSLGSAFCYFLSTHSEKVISSLSPTNGLVLANTTNWRALGRVFFIIQFLSVIGIFTTLYYIISHHLFEYRYAWAHSSRTLETKYLFSCFWEGQEGSFLLWSFWNSVLGLVFAWRQRSFESPVMTIVAGLQVVLATMILGINASGWHIGSNPFQLLRNTELLANAPAFYAPDATLRMDYLTLIKDGNDLNILLQNYWMVIHPPVLFLGFASTIIPFALALGGLWTRRFTEWTKPALSWSLFSAAILGLGIMMGAKWAYESLNFGGYWAWDPVENASLVPWLILVAGIHTLLIYRHTGNALRTTYLFLILCFGFILYSTYLTRSGDLQDTSVHAFTGDGITKWHLRILLLIFTLPALALFFTRYKKIPHIVKEEETSAREFWMFVGSLILFLSATTIILMTSIPVINKLASLSHFNKLFGKDELFHPLAVGEDVEHAYNRIQIFVAIILGVFTGFGMYLRYKTTSAVFLRKIWLPLLTAIVIAGVLLAIGHVDFEKQGAGFKFSIWLAVVAAVFAAVANGSYVFTGFKGKLFKAGGAISHFGFALVLLGILISSSKKEVLSYNTSGIAVPFGEGSKENSGENLTLVKGLRGDMGKYWVTYTKDSADPKKASLWYYNLAFERKDGRENFTLTPNAFVNPKGNQGLSANPDARHYASHDIFVYISSLPDPNRASDTASFRDVHLHTSDTAFYSKGYIVLEEVSVGKNVPGLNLGATDSLSIARLKIASTTGATYTMQAAMLNRNSISIPKVDTLIAEGLVFSLNKATGKEITLGIKESDSVLQYVTLKAYKFPYINVLWAGTVIMVLGILISMYNRRSRQKSKAIFVHKAERAQARALENLGSR